MYPYNFIIIVTEKSYLYISSSFTIFAVVKLTNFDKMHKRGSFGSRFGAIAAAAGSAIGLGNIWRYPYVVGENGGAAFILLYLIIIFLIGLPCLMSEFALGRFTRKNVFGAFRKLSPNGKWYLIGVLGIITAFVILAFYSVVAGWTVAFLKESLMNEFSGLSAGAIGEKFDTFVASGWEPLAWSFLFCLATALIVMLGIEKGIERYNKILMPMLFLILLVLCVNSFSLDGFKEGMAFLFKPDFSKITVDVALSALGQAFFSLSLGMGTMMTYGSYIRKQDNLLTTSSTVAITDLSIALLAGIAIFPAVFSFGIEPGSGPDLVFKTLPNIFSQMPGGYFLGVLFFLLLVVAALTSSVSILEVLVAYCSEELRLSRKNSVIICAVLAFIASVICAVSQMPDSSLTIAGKNIFDFLDIFSSSYLMPIGGFLIVVFTGWFFGKQRLHEELSSEGKYKIRYFNLFLFIVKFLAPIAIAFIFLSKIGML